MDWRRRSARARLVVIVFSFVVMMESRRSTSATMVFVHLVMEPVKEGRGKFVG